MLSFIKDEKRSKFQILSFLEKSGFDEWMAEDLLYKLEDLPFVSAKMENGITYYFVPGFGKDIIKEILPEKIQVKYLDRKESRKERKEIGFLIDEQIVEKLMNMIKTAKKEIILCYYDINNPILIDPIIKALKKKKRVIIIYKRSPKFIEKIRDKIKNQEDIKLLKNLEDKFVKDIHCKMAIKDREELMVSSKNLTKGNLRDTGIWTHDEEIIKQAIRYINSLKPGLIVEKYQK